MSTRTRIYEPLSQEDIDWLRRYVERNSEHYPGTRDARLWGRFLATLESAVAAERDRVLLEISKVRQSARMDDKFDERIWGPWIDACNAIREAVMEGETNDA